MCGSANLLPFAPAASKTAAADARAEGFEVSHAQVSYIKPFPKNLGKLLLNFEHVIVPELNMGQLVKIIRDKYFIPAEGLNKIQGMPFTSIEIKEKIIDFYKSK